MAYCDSCGNYDDEHTDGMPEYQTGQDYQPELYYYWQYPLEEDYLMPNGYEYECMCEICFDIAKEEGKIQWKCAS